MRSNEIRIEDIWAAEQSILDEIDRVCKENGLRYSLAYGTLLGAVRHKGFIPWDDDVDIFMPREDYERLKEIWSDTAAEGFILQDCESDGGPANNFVKIRKDNTTFIMFEEERDRAYHKGIYVDIFPVDRLAPGRIGKAVQKLLFAVNLLFSRGYQSGTGGAVGFVEKILLGIVRRKNYKRLSRWAGRRSRRWNNTANNRVCACTLQGCKRILPADMFDEMKTVSFSGREYPAVKDADAMLRIIYGDYMQLPPEEERVWKHHPILVDFEHNYEELVKEGKV